MTCSETVAKSISGSWASSCICSCSGSGSGEADEPDAEPGTQASYIIRGGTFCAGDSRRERERDRGGTLPPPLDRRGRAASRVCGEVRTSGSALVVSAGVLLLRGGASADGSTRELASEPACWASPAPVEMRFSGTWCVTMGPAWGSKTAKKICGGVLESEKHYS